LRTDVPGAWTLALKTARKGDSGIDRHKSSRAGRAREAIADTAGVVTLAGVRLPAVRLTAIVSASTHTSPDQDEAEQTTTTSGQRCRESPRRGGGSGGQGPDV